MGLAGPSPGVFWGNLGSQDEVRIFEQAIEEDDQLAHDSGESDEGLFARGCR